MYVRLYTVCVCACVSGGREGWGEGRMGYTVHVRVGHKCRVEWGM